MSKTCCRCKKTLPKTEFMRHGDSLQPFCRECNKIYQKEYYKKHKDRWYRKNKKRKAEAREWFYSLKSKLKCQTCGEKHPACLDFHHRDGSAKEFTLSRYFQFGKDRVLLEMEKCDILCANCHRKIHFSELV